MRIGRRRARVKRMRRVVIVLGLLLPSVASASNGAGVRTPPIFPQAACITDVNRSEDPVFHLDIGLAREDFMVTEDEPPDSRRFQFFMVCEDVHRDFLELPDWITVAEAEDAIARGTLAEMPPDEEILERRPDLAGCVYPMNPSTARMPITCAATGEGLDFDTTELPAGNYVVRGYTYEPPLNLWSVRRGVVRIYDDAEAPLPSAGLRSPSLDGMQLRPGSPFSIQGCAVDTCDVQLQYASLIDIGTDDEVWETFATVGAGEFDVAFDPPETLVGQPLLFRAVADPSGSTPWIDHAEGTALVFGDDNESDQPFGEPLEICGLYDPEIEPPAPAAAGELTCSEPEEEGPEPPSDRAGCACALHGPESTSGTRAGWLFLALLALGTRRRERPHCG